MRRLLPVVLALIAACTDPAEKPPEGLASGSLIGRVVLREGSASTPVVGAVVSLEGTRLGVRTGSDGRFAFSGLPAATFLLVAKQGTASMRVTAKVDPARDVGDVVLGAPGTVRVVVRQGATAIAGAVVALARTGTQTTNADGRAEFTAVAPGAWQVAALTSGGLVTPVAFTLAAGETREVVLEGAMIASGRVAVRVAGPASAATVELVSGATHVPLPEVAATPAVHADEDVPAGIYRVVARRDGQATITLPAVFPGSDEAVILFTSADCETNATGACAQLDPSDRDGDGIADGRDLCPDVADPQQVDANADGLGDACACVPRVCEANADCGSIDDGCGGTIACGDCTAPLTCGGGNEEHRCGCTGETDDELCAAGTAACGSTVVEDRCGAERTAVCGDCVAPETCGDVAPNQCACVPEDDAALCEAAAAECGALLVNDHCGTEREVASCGECTGPESCGGGGVEHVCGCTAETDAELCEAHGACGGPITWTDRCGVSREVTCGGCTGPATCGGGGTPNVCGCPVIPDAQLCASLGWSCGTYQDTWCGRAVTANCGTCTAPEACGGGLEPHACGVRLDGWATLTPADTSTDLQSVMMPTADRAWAVGKAGTAVHWDGTAWARVELGHPGNATGVWALADDDVWVAMARDASGQGRVLHWDGTTWATLARAAVDFTGIWASGPQDVWVTTGDTGSAFVWHWNGAAWSTLPTGLPDGLWGISGTGPGDVWVAGTSAGIAHLENGAFVDRRAGNGSLGTFQTVYARAADDVWFGGTPTQLWHWNGSAISAMNRESTGLVTSLWADAPGAVAVAQPGNVALPTAYFDGTFWSHAGPTVGVISAIHGHGSTAWGVGRAGTLLRWSGGANWTEPSPNLTVSQLKSIWLANDHEGWAVGGSGTALHLQADGWHAVGVTPSLNVYAVWGTGAEDVWMVGSAGNLWRWNGTTITRTSIASTSVEFTGMDGTSATDVWACGGSSTPTLLHFDGSTWNPVTVPGTTAFYFTGVWARSPSDVWVLGNNGSVSRWNGTSWSTVRAATGGLTYGISGTSPTDVYVASSFGLYRYDGTTWRLDSPNAHYAVRAVAPGEAWAYGAPENGALPYHRDPATGAWKRSWTGTPQALLGIFALSPKDVWMVGDRGTVLRRVVP